jgi:protein-disulfide isomerase
VQTDRRKWLIIVLGLLLVSVLDARTGFAQSADDIKALRNDIQSLKEGMAAIQRDLQELKTLLQQQARQAPAAGSPPPQDIVLSLDGTAPKGEKNAKVTLVEYTDYQCPFCSRYVRETLPQIEKDYIKTGKVKYVVREFPLESIHPQALKASEAALCAGEQKKYWDMHDRLFADQKALGVNDLPKHAAAVGLDVPKFQQCLESGKQAATVRKDQASGQKAGVTGTPSFFLGIEQPNGSVKVLKSLRGAQPYAAFKEAIDSLLPSQ